MSTLVLIFPVLEIKPKGTAPDVPKDILHSALTSKKLKTNQMFLDGLNKWCYSHTTEYYTAIKEDTVEDIHSPENGLEGNTLKY